MFSMPLLAVVTGEKGRNWKTCLLIQRFKRGEFGPLILLVGAGCDVAWGVEILENKGFRANGAFGAGTRAAGSRNFCDPKRCKHGEKTGREFRPHDLPPVIGYFWAPFFAHFLKTPKKRNIHREGKRRGNGKSVNRKNGKTLQK